MKDIHIAGTGIWYPEDTISNDEIVLSFNSYVDNFNTNNKDRIDSGEIEKLEYSSTEFIEKASGTKTRHVIDKKNILNINKMDSLLKKTSSGNITEVIEDKNSSDSSSEEDWYDEETSTYEKIGMILIQYEDILDNDNLKNIVKLGLFKSDQDEYMFKKIAYVIKKYKEKVSYEIMNKIVELLTDKVFAINIASYEELINILVNIFLLLLVILLENHPTSSLLISATSYPILLILLKPNINE